jgi:hypothetical protein
VAAATQNQVLNALAFLYGKVLEQPLGNIGDTVRAKRPPRLPVVLSHDEAMAVITALRMPNLLDTNDSRSAMNVGAVVRHHVMPVACKRQ